MSLSRLHNFQIRQDRRRRVSRIPLSRLRDRQNPLEWFNAAEFKMRYHLYKETALFVISLIELDLSHPLRRGVYIPPTIQCLAVLRFQLSNADLHQVSHPTISHLVKRVSIAIAKLRSRFIKYPRHAEAERYRRDFHALAGFRGVVGAVDCTHIHILSPGGEDAELYRYRKSRFSLNVQAICDSKLVFTNLVAHWYGSAHDSRIFENSLIRDNLVDNEIPGLLVGDAGYPLLSCLLTPVEKPASRAERRYNYAQIRTRNVIERVFGVVKRIFPCLKKLRLKLSTSMIVIVSVFILHNIARERMDIYANDTFHDLDEDEPSEEEVVAAATGSTSDGRSFRAAFINDHFD